MHATPTDLAVAFLLICVSQCRFAGTLRDLAAQTVKVQLCWDYEGKCVAGETKALIGHFELPLALLLDGHTTGPLPVTRCLNNKLAVVNIKLSWCPFDFHGLLTPLADTSMC